MPSRKTSTDRAEAPPPTELAELTDLAATLHSGAIHLLRAMSFVDREAGLTPARLSALSVLVFGGPGPMGRLAQAEGVSAPTMTRIVAALETAGLVRRSADPDNARVVIVTATPTGRRLMLAARRRRLTAIVAGLEALTPAERAALLVAGPALSRLPTLVPGRHTGASAGRSRRCAR